MRNSHGLAHGKSDLYVVVHLEAEDGAVVSIDEDEIDAAAWHDLEEVAAWTTHPINRECLRALGVDGVHGANAPVTPGPIADPNTIRAAAIALIAPRIFTLTIVPGNNAYGHLTITSNGSPSGDNVSGIYP